MKRICIAVGVRASTGKLSLVHAGESASEAVRKAEEARDKGQFSEVYVYRNPVPFKRIRALGQPPEAA